jgi:hypothetical protein
MYRHMALHDGQLIPIGTALQRVPRRGGERGVHRFSTETRDEIVCLLLCIANQRWERKQSTLFKLDLPE